MEKAWLTYDDAAEYTGFSRSLIQKTVQAGGLAYAKVGASVRFKREWLDDWLEAHATRRHALDGVGMRQGREILRDADVA